MYIKLFCTKNSKINICGKQICFHRPNNVFEARIEEIIMFFAALVVFLWANINNLRFFYPIGQAF